MKIHAMGDCPFYERKTPCFVYLLICSMKILELAGGIRSMY